jgi:hypothetical protein
MIRCFSAWLWYQPPLRPRIPLSSVSYKAPSWGVGCRVSDFDVDVAKGRGKRAQPRSRSTDVLPLQEHGEGQADDVTAAPSLGQGAEPDDLSQWRSRCVLWRLAHVSEAPVLWGRSATLLDDNMRGSQHILTPLLLEVLSLELFALFPRHNCLPPQGHPSA